VQVVAKPVQGCCTLSNKTEQLLARLCKTVTYLFATVQVLGNDDAHSSVTVQLLLCMIVKQLCKC
jgi:hypothetical protein